VSATVCERCASPIETGDLRCAICGGTVPPGAAPRASTTVDVHRCQGCGAAVEYDPATQAPTCAFCNRSMELERIEDPVEQTEGYLPFTVDAEAARSALRRWLGSLGFFRPSDLRSSARLETLLPVWWVAWVFDAEALVSWAADSDAGAQSADWAPHAGQVQMEFDDLLVSASRGLTEQEARTLASSYDLGTVRPAPAGAEGARIECFDVQRSLARRRIVEALRTTAAERVERDHVPGSQVRNLKLEVLLSGLATRRLAFPAYVMAYRYRDRLFRVVVCGQEASLLIGRAPWSGWKIALVVAGAFALLLLGLRAVL
jgi:hypothetical protein